MSLMVIAVCICAVFFVKNTISSLEDDLKKVQLNIENFDLDSALKNTQTFEQNWEKKGKKLSMFMDHIKIESVDQTISVLKANLEMKRHEDANVELFRVKKLFCHISETEMPTIDNIL